MALRLPVELAMTTELAPPWRKSCVWGLLLDDLCLSAFALFELL